MTYCQIINPSESFSRILLRNMLEGLGFCVEVAEDGLRAWELFKKGGIKMLITGWIVKARIHAGRKAREKGDRVCCLNPHGATIRKN